MDNTIYGQTAAGINIGGSTYADIMYNSIYENHYGINFNMGEVLTDPDPPSSGTVNIEDNNIYSNSMAGITVRDAITSEVTIAGNDIHDNVRGGIGIMNSCNLVINRNEIHGNQRSGIHTGGSYEVEDDYFADSNIECTAAGEPYDCCTGLGTGTCNSSVGFIGNTDSAILDVSQNKVYGNCTSGYGAGIDIRHASGTIYNNLVYENAMCGIRYGNYIDEISNNTVVDNGIGMMGFGGGIIYDSLDGYVADIPFGDGPLIPIRNNIIAFHPSAGIRTGERGVCLSGDYRDYNLLFGNNNTPIDVTPITWPPWKICPQLGSCWWSDNEIFADPEFVDRDNDDYRIQVTSLAVDAGDTGYDLNTDCTDVGVPYPCCTGIGAGTCPSYDYGDDYSTGCSGLPCYGVGTTAIDIGAYGGQYPIDW
jgi:parallel beta-helix repeat protein